MSAVTIDIVSRGGVSEINLSDNDTVQVFMVFVDAGVQYSY